MTNPRFLATLPGAWLRNIMVFAAFLMISVTGLAQDGDAMGDFMNEAGDTMTDAPADAAKGADKNAGKEATSNLDAEMTDPAPTDASAPKAAPKADSATTVADSIPSTPNPALDRIDAMAIGDSEFKAFMKAGGLRSKKIK